MARYSRHLFFLLLMWGVACADTVIIGAQVDSTVEGPSVARDSRHSVGSHAWWGLFWLNIAGIACGVVDVIRERFLPMSDPVDKGARQGHCGMLPWWLRVVSAAVVAATMGAAVNVCIMRMPASFLGTLAFF
jgi:hypothetical protein